MFFLNIGNKHQQSMSATDLLRYQAILFRCVSGLDNGESLRNTHVTFLNSKFYFKNIKAEVFNLMTETRMGDLCLHLSSDVPSTEFANSVDLPNSNLVLLKVNGVLVTEDKTTKQIKPLDPSFRYSVVFTSGTNNQTTRTRDFITADLESDIPNILDAVTTYSAATLRMKVTVLNWLGSPVAVFKKKGISVLRVDPNAEMDVDLVAKNHSE